ncbi:hypothetical protein ACYE2N_00490 [Flavobacterium sp. MAHUQ-51]|uniref:hypothetical protein n=1 Tax=Flavobacterium sp. GCM10022190 TaxID=3252639 RepID=UPI0036D2D575
MAEKAGIASKVIASATYDGLKKVLDFSTLKSRISKFFKKEEDADKYIETICNTESKNSSKPFRDVEDCYEEVSGESYNEELYNEVKKWIEENQEQITKVSKMEFENEKGFNIGVQNAGKNIFNIQGDYKPHKD